MPLCSRRTMVVLGAVLLVFPTLSLAQQTATLSGLVSDQTGASVAGAKVELLSGPGGARATTTDSGGRYRFEVLGPVDFVSPTARNSPPLSLFVDGGSFGSLNGRATAGGAGDTVDGLLTVEGRSFDGYRDHSDQERWGLYGNAGWRPSETTHVQLFATYVHNDLRLPGALTREEVAEDPDQASQAALDGNYGKVVKTARVAAKATWSLGGNGTLAAGLSYEGQSLLHPIVDRILIDFDGPGPNPPVEVFSLLVDTDHRDFGAMVRYDQRLGRQTSSSGSTTARGRWRAATTAT